MSQESDEKPNLSEMGDLNWPLSTVIQKYEVHIETETLMSVESKVQLEKPSKTKQRTHIKREINSWADFKWICQQCNQTTQCLAELRQHTQLVHNIYFGAKCINCPKVLNSHRDFVAHVVKHMAYLRNYCQYCNKYILNRTAMIKHIQDHSISTPPCDVCGQIFTNTDNLTEHIATKCVKYKAPEPEAPTCDICYKQFAKITNLKKHKAIHDPDRKRNFQCQSCDSAFFTKIELKEHAMRHTVPNEVCEVCSKKFHTRRDLNSHLRSHSSVRPFECNECGKRFGTKRNLVTHLICHSDEKRFKCKLCPKAFKQRNDWKAHEDAHRGIRNYKCEVCDKSYTAWKSCDVHMRTKHGMTLAKNKITPVGKVAIDRSTGELQEASKDWMNKLLKQNCDKPDKEMIVENVFVKIEKNDEDDKSPDLSIEIKEEKIDGEFPQSSIEASSSEDKQQDKKDVLPVSSVPFKEFVAPIVKVEVSSIPDQDDKKMSFPATTTRSEPRHDKPKKVGSWKDYKWTCRICDHLSSSLSSLCAHTRSVHKEYFAVKCVDCGKLTKTHRVFVKHVYTHRTYLRQYCQYCDENIKDKHEMSEHIAEHLALSSPCDTCGQIFPTKSILNEHIQTECDSRSGAAKQGVPSCDICHKTFKLYNSLLRHMTQIHDSRRAREYTCDKCDRSYYTKRDLLTHKKRHYDKNEKCDQCNKAFYTKSELRRHSYIHTPEKQYVCHDCGKGFRNKQNLINHVSVHTGVDIFNCGDCGKQFKTFSTLKAHKYVHLPKSVACERCDKVFKSSKECTDHMFTDHGVLVDKNVLKPKTDEEVPKSDIVHKVEIEIDVIRIKEEHVEEVIVKEERVEEVIVKEESVEVIVKKEREVEIPLSTSTEVIKLENDKLTTWENYNWLCSKCDFTTRRLTHLREHTQSEHNKYFVVKCPDCFKEMKSHFTFVDHVTKHRPHLQNYCQFCNHYTTVTKEMQQHIEDHKTTAPFCDGCGETFQNRPSLSSHLKKCNVLIRRRRSYTIEDLTCDICSKAYNTMGALRKHSSIHVQRSRNYICDICHHGFYTKKTLCDHIQRHSKTKNICPICSKSCPTPNDLYKHRLTHLPDCSFQCDICDKKFRSKLRLRCHEVIHNDVKRFKCRECGKAFKYQSTLKGHESTHSGLRPYECEYCEETFVTWHQCDRHMLKAHGITFAKTKYTSVGRATIDRVTGELEEGAKDWTNQLLENKNTD